MRRRRNNAAAESGTGSATRSRQMFLSVFDGFKIGIGPSSSHTIGPKTVARGASRASAAHRDGSRVPSQAGSAFEPAAQNAGAHKGTKEHSAPKAERDSRDVKHSRALIILESRRSFPRTSAPRRAGCATRVKTIQKSHACSACIGRRRATVAGQGWLAGPKPSLDAEERLTDDGTAPDGKRKKVGATEGGQNYFFSFRIMRERCTLTVFWERFRDTKVLV